MSTMDAADVNTGIVTTVKSDSRILLTEIYGTPNVGVAGNVPVTVTNAIAVAGTVPVTVSNPVSVSGTVSVIGAVDTSGSTITVTNFPYSTWNISLLTGATGDLFVNGGAAVKVRAIRMVGSAVVGNIGIKHGSTTIETLTSLLGLAVGTERRFWDASFPNGFAINSSNSSNAVIVIWQ